MFILIHTVQLNYLSQTLIYQSLTTSIIYITQKYKRHLNNIQQKQHSKKCMKTRKATNRQENAQNAFMEDLEDSLLQINDDPYGIDAFQQVYNKKKNINQRIQKQYKKKIQVKDALQRAKQRIAQIQQLNGKVEKQASLLKNQVSKINQVHMMGKILMMEKILKLQRQTEQLQKKRNKNYEVRVQKQRASLTHRVYALNKIEKTRAQSLSKTIQLENQKQIQQYTNWKSKKKRIQEMKNEKERRKKKAQRIQEYKKMIAQKNYQQKINQLQNALDNKQDELNLLERQQNQQQRHFRATQNVTNEYIGTFFTTETI